MGGHDWQRAIPTKGNNVMRPRTFIVAAMVVLGTTTAQAITQDEIRAKLKSAGVAARSALR